MKKLILVTLVSNLLFSNELDNLLQEIQEQSKQEQIAQQEKERKFLNEKNEQAAILSNLKSQLSRLEESIKSKEEQNDINQKQISDLEEELSLKSVNLDELFGVAKHAAKDLASVAKISLLRSEYKLDESFIGLLETNSLPNAKELEILWTTYLNEIINSGKVRKYNTNVILKNGIQANAQVTRAGVFTAFSDGKFFKFEPDSQNLVEYTKQAKEFTKYAKNIDPSNEMLTLLVDPTKGALLNIESLKPDIKDRLEQAGSVGYVIIALGILGFILALYQLIRLFLINSKIKKQIKNLNNLSANNPLGRVLLHIKDEQNPKKLESKLSQAVLRESPKIDSLKNFIKLLAGVAPMLGLLGTVVGMIGTFQAITLFGTGEPKLMAGGISEALITTVLGLIVAIPLLFLYSILNSKSQNIFQIIYEQSAGLISQKEE